MTDKKISVLIVDDSAVARFTLEHLLSQDPEIEVMKSLATPLEALDFLKTSKPNVLLVDIVMPEMNGYDFVKAMKQEHDIPAIIISSLFKKEDKAKVMKAYEVGAVAILEKPIGSDQEKGDELLTIIHGIFKQQNRNREKIPIKRSIRKQKFDLIAIGASLGGPEAIRTIVQALPREFPIPIVIVQHFGSGFAEGFITWLNKYSKNIVELAQNHRTPEPGKIYLAPFDTHLKISKEGNFFLSNEAPVNGLRPTVDIFFESLVTSYGKNVIAVLLTGMGADGAHGMLTLRNAGAYTIAQHQDGCTIFGMPKAAIERDAAEAIIPLNEIAGILTQIIE